VLLDNIRLSSTLSKKKKNKDFFPPLFLGKNYERRLYRTLAQRTTQAPDCCHKKEEHTTRLGVGVGFLGFRAEEGEVTNNCGQRGGAIAVEDTCGG
jgi:hypothetical protein